MRRRDLLGLMGGLLAAPLFAAESRTAGAISTQFGAADWPSIRAGFAGRPAIVHLWGVTCAPCVEELPRWVQLMQRRRATQIVLVHLDPVPTQRVEAALRRVGFEGGKSFVLRGIADERLRYRIDPKWGGELPRTLLLGADGSVQERFSGSADFAALARWLERSAAKG